MATDKRVIRWAMTTLLKTFAWLLAAAVAFATLGPPGLRPHSGLGQDGEHALAFLLIGLAFGLAYPRRLQTVMIAVAMIGLIEVLQFWAPGRHARWSDFVVDALNKLPGVSCLAMPGTFYAFANVESAMKLIGAHDDGTFAEYLLNHAGVAVVPGSGFGAPGHMRLSYACSMQTLEDAMRRIDRTLRAAQAA